jgi:hypothetical protein
VARLHIYRKIGKIWAKTADGDGVVDRTNPFAATLTAGSVTPDRTYEIRKGTSATGTLFYCTAVTGATATFRAGD